jgi:branched-chain amino acid transport system substrate-binding protein
MLHPPFPFRSLVLSATVAAIALGAQPATAQLAGSEIHIGVGGPLTTGSATFGVEMRQAVDLAVAEANAAGGILGGKIVVDVADDAASNQQGESVAKGFCDQPAILGVVGHVNSGVTIAASKVYAGCGLAMITPMSSNPGVTENGLANVFRLTNRDDRKGPGLARYLISVMGKKRAIVIDDQTPYGHGLADAFSKGFEAAGGTIVARDAVKVGDTQFGDLVKGFPGDFDVVFFGGIREGALVLKEMREEGINQLFTCGDGCWDVKGFIVPSQGAANKGEGVRILSAAPALGKVPGSAAFAESYAAKYGPINNYAASSYDSARVLFAAIEAAAKQKQAMPTRAEVVAALKSIRFQGLAYAKPVAWNEKGDNTGAVIFVNVVDGDHFKEVDQIGE